MHIVVEGIVGSGKTEFIKSNYSHLHRVPELSETGIIMPEFSLNEEEIFTSNIMLVNLDLKRFIEQKEPSVFDRWIFSTFAYAYARNKIYGISDGAQLRSITKNINLEFSLEIMNTPFDVCMNRLAQRKNTALSKYLSSTKEPYNLEFYSAMNDYFIEIKNIKSINLADYVLH